MNTVNDNKGISLQEIMKDEEIRTINDIQYNEKRVLELILPYYTELKSISNEYLPIGIDSIIGMLKNSYEEILSYTDEIRQLFILIHTKFIRLLSIFADCENSKPILNNMKPFSTNKEENDRLIEEQIKVNEENKNNFLLKITPILREYIQNRYIKEIGEQVFSQQIQPINQNVLRVFSYYFCNQIIKLIHSVSGDLDDTKVMNIIKLGIGHILTELLELTFNVTIKITKDETESIVIERMRNKKEYYDTMKGMFIELIDNGTFINNVKNNKMTIKEYTQTNIIHQKRSIDNKQSNKNSIEKKPRKVQNDK